MALVILGTIAWITYANSAGVEASNALGGQVRHAQLATETLLSTLKDAETGQRGFLLTGNPAYLEPYDAARQRLDADFKRLEQAPLPDNRWMAAIGRMQELGTAKLAELGQTVELGRAGQTGAALDIVRTNQGKEIMDALRAEADTLQTDAENELAQARVKANSARAWAEPAGLAVLASTLLAAVAMEQRRAGRVIAASFARLERFTRAFGLAPGMFRAADGRITFWGEGAERLYGYPAAAAGRRAVRIMGTIRDVTAIRKAEHERQQAASLLRTIMETAPGLIYAKNREGRMLLANAPALDLIGKPWAEVEGRTDLEYLDDPAQAEAVMANNRRIMEASQAEEMEELVGTEGAHPRVWLSTKMPLCGADGKVTGLVGVSVEITERKRTEERLRLVIHELNHRVKNTLATVQAIASQTLRSTDPGVRQSLEGRLIALSSAHDALTREAWRGAELHDVVAGALAPHGWPESARFRVSGPPVRLQSQAAVALSMGLHEMATNALKYGALLAKESKVEIRWEIGGSGTPQFRLTWTERGGPVAAPPTRRGFGTKLVECSLAQDLGGTARIAFAPEGVTCEVEAPLAEVAAAAEVMPFLRVGSLGGD